MLDFVIFAITFVIVLIATVFYLYPGTRRSGTTIPGMDPSDPKEGNLADIQMAGSLHEFLMRLHSEYGPIASFWLETQLVISLASPKLFAEHQHVFDRAGDLFMAFKPLFGNGSVFFTNGIDARKQHRTLVESFASTSCFQTFNQASEELVLKLESLPVDQHVPLTQYMMALSAKSILVSLLGDSFLDTTNILEFRGNYEICMLDIEQKLQGMGVDEATIKSKVDTAIKSLRNQMRKTLAARKASKNGDELLIDKLLTTANYSEEQMIDNVLTFVHMGFQLTGCLLTWLFYYLATSNEVQDKVYSEVSSVDVGRREGNTFGEEQMKKLKYTRQVIDETLRLSSVTTFTTRRQELDVEIGGHRVPKNTPVIHAIGVVHLDDTVWNSAEKFDPDRFSSQPSNSLTFNPFGFSGKRKCPATDLVYSLATIVLVNIIRHLKIQLIDDDQIVQTNYCIYSKPKDEIWATFAPRNH